MNKAQRLQRHLTVCSSGVATSRVSAPDADDAGPDFIRQNPTAGTRNAATASPGNESGIGSSRPVCFGIWPAPRKDRIAVHGGRPTESAVIHLMTLLEEPHESA
jgi:hypothetical protein